MTTPSRNVPAYSWSMTIPRSLTCWKHPSARLPRIRRHPRRAGDRSLPPAAPRLMLLDVMMPGPDGYEVCRRLKFDPVTRDVPIIFVTARAEIEEEIRGLEAGAVDFLSKPVHRAIVLARVRTHIALRQQAAKLRDMAMTDILTGVANRRCIEERLDIEWRRCGASGADAVS